MHDFIHKRSTECDVSADHRPSRMQAPADFLQGLKATSVFLNVVWCPTDPGIVQRNLCDNVNIPKLVPKEKGAVLPTKVSHGDGDHGIESNKDALEHIGRILSIC